jgi:hypothetical protein
MPETSRRMQRPAFIRQVPPSRLARAVGRSVVALALLALLILMPCGHAAGRMKAANYPAHFVKVAQEINVPAGIEWHARRVNLAPMRTEVWAIVAGEQHKHAEAPATGEAGEAATGLAPDAGNAATSTPANPASAARRGWALLWFVVALLVLLLFVCGALLLRRRYGGDAP